MEKLSDNEVSEPQPQNAYVNFEQDNDGESQYILQSGPISEPFKEELSLLKGNDSFNCYWTNTKDCNGKQIDERTAAILSEQLNRKEKLRNAVILRKSEIAMLKREVEALRERLQPFPSVQLGKLKEENNQLRIECDLMTQEVDKRTSGNVPLGETSEIFYRGINPGQGVNALIKNITKNQPNLHPPPPGSTPSSGPNNTRVSGRYPTGSRTKPPPPRPPPPKYLPIPNQFDTSPDGEWNCTVCTFKNHPDLKECEQCAMVRFQPSPTNRNLDIEKNFGPY